MAAFYTFLPWILVVPLQTGYWLYVFTNWTTVIFICSSNFIIPYWLYILSQRRKVRIIPAKESSDGNYYNSLFIYILLHCVIIIIIIVRLFSRKTKEKFD